MGITGILIIVSFLICLFLDGVVVTRTKKVRYKGHEYTVGATPFMDAWGVIVIIAVIIYLIVASP